MWYNNFFTIDTSCNKMSQSKMAKYKNNQAWQNEFCRNLIDAQNRYHIENLPSTCSQRVIQQGLLWSGAVCFFKMQESVLCLPAVPDGSGLNLYGDYAGAYVYGANGFNRHISVMLPGSEENAEIAKTISGLHTSGDPQGVLVWENDMLRPFIQQIIYYTEMMSQTLRKIEVATRYAAVGHVFVADESIAKTAEATIRSIYDDNVDHVISSGIFDPTKFQAVNFTENPTSLQSLTAAYEWYSSQYRILCGTAAASNMDKKGENLISDEIHVGDEYAEMQSQHVIDCIQRRLDVANEFLGTNMAVVRGGESYDDISDDEGIDDGSVPGDHPGGSAGDDQ